MIKRTRRDLGSELILRRAGWKTPSLKPASTRERVDDLERSCTRKMSRLHESGDDGEGLIDTVNGSRE